MQENRTLATQAHRSKVVRQGVLITAVSRLSAGALTTASASRYFHFGAGRGGVRGCRGPQCPGKPVCVASSLAYATCCSFPISFRQAPASRAIIRNCQGATVGNAGPMLTMRGRCRTNTIAPATPTGGITNRSKT